MSDHLNDVVTELLSENELTELVLSQAPTDNEHHLDGEYGPLLQFIQSRGNLRSLCLDHILDIEVIRLLLNAASMNSAIEKLGLEHMTIPGPVLFNHLQTKLYSSIHMGDLTILEREYLVGLLQEAPLVVFGSDVHLRLHQMDEYIITPLLHYMSGHLYLKKLYLHAYFMNECLEGPPVEMSVQLATSISKLVKSSSTIECIIFYNYIFTAPNFGIIAECLGRSTSLQEIGFFHCNFEVEASYMFEHMLISPLWKIPAVKVGHATEFNFITNHEIFHNILNSKPRNSPLNKLLLYSSGNDDYVRLLKPLEGKASLDFLDLGIIGTPIDFSHLLISIPLMRGLKVLNFILSENVRDRLNYRRDMLLQFGRNHCLEAISVSWLGTEGRYEEHQLDQLCLRNRFVKHWLTSPQDVPHRLLPFILEKALKYAYSTEIVMKGLMASWMTK
jgi:hypothetical protein